MANSPWATSQLGELFFLQLGKMLNKAARETEPRFPYLGNREVQWGRFDLNDLRRMHFNSGERKKFALQPGDLLVCEGGEVGRTALWRGQMECYFQKALHRLRPRTKEAEPEFMLHFMRFAADHGLLADYTSQSSIAHLTREKLSLIKVPVPPLPEQRKIAAILTAVDETIVKTEAVIEQLGIVKKAMMQELLTRGLPGRHTRFKKTEIGEIPEEWEVVRMVDVADVDYGISAAVSKNTDADIGWPILTGANITLRGTLDLSKLVYIAAPSKDSFKLQNNDLLLNWRSGSPQHVGKTALYDLGPGYTYASFVLRVRCRERWIPAFGHLLLNFMRDNEYFTRDLSQQVNFKMNAGVFREVKVLCPPLDEQAEIARRIAVIANRVAAERKLADQLRTTKSALMSVLLTGELRVSTEPG